MISLPSEPVRNKSRELYECVFVLWPFISLGNTALYRLRNLSATARFKVCFIFFSPVNRVGTSGTNPILFQGGALIYSCRNSGVCLTCRLALVPLSLAARKLLFRLEITTRMRVFSSVTFRDWGSDRKSAPTAWHKQSDPSSSISMSTRHRLAHKPNKGLMPPLRTCACVLTFIVSKQGASNVNVKPNPFAHASLNAWLQNFANESPFLNKASFTDVIFSQGSVYHLATRQK